MTIKFTISRSLIEDTLAHLRAAGRHNSEGIVLWFAQRANRRMISKILVPTHDASDDYFHITPEGNRQIRDICSQEKLVLEAQVHTHPNRAFHSKADDRLAVLRHVDALSIVLPRFALTTTPESFLSDSASFLLNANDRWEQIEFCELSKLLHITA